MLLLAFQLVRPFHTHDNQWQHNKMAMMIVIFIAMITELIMVLLISFVHFLLRCRVRALVDLFSPPSLCPSLPPASSGLKDLTLLALAIHCFGFFYSNTYFPLLLLKMIYARPALLHNHICWTPQNLLGTVCETRHHLSCVFPKLIPGKSRILSDSLPTLYHLG